MRIRFSVETRGWQGAIRDWRASAYDKVEAALFVVGNEAVDWLRSYVRSTRTADGRPAHPGGWGDVTHELEQSYGFDVFRDGDMPSLRLFNTSGHAIFLEHRDGYWVIRGAMDKGGPVDRALRTVIPRIAPGWRVI